MMKVDGSLSLLLSVVTRYVQLRGPRELLLLQLLLLGLMMIRIHFIHIELYILKYPRLLS